MPPLINIEQILEGPKTFCRAEVEKSRQVIQKSVNGTKYAENLPWYTIIDNKVYDIREFISDHPGGAVILTHIGKDASDAFYNFHPSSAYDMLANYYVGDVADEIEHSNGFTKELREIRKLFINLKYYESSKAYYAFKLLGNIGIWSISIMILAAFGNSFYGVLSSAAAMALFWQQCGWLAHDFLHHQVFENRRHNDLVGCFLGSICLGFDPAWWKDKHNTHHAATNVHGQDPDINTHPLLSWSENALTDLFDPEKANENSKLFPPWIARLMVDYQPLSYYPILTLANISWCIQSILFILPSGQIDKPVNARMPITLTQQISLAIHYVWFIAILSLIDSWSLVFAFIILSKMICGILLAIVFSLNHCGMKVLTEEESMKTSFFVEQIITGRDVVTVNPMNQWIVDWFTGGLNYQIEHHLFPGIPRHHFHKIAPIIQSLCRKYDIPYHKTTFLEGTLEIFGLLNRVARARKNYNY